MTTHKQFNLASVSAAFGLGSFDMCEVPCTLISRRVPLKFLEAKQCSRYVTKVGQVGIFETITAPHGRTKDKFVEYQGSSGRPPRTFSL